MSETITGSDIATIVETNPVSVLIDTKIYAQFYQHIKDEVETFDPDLSTAASRKQIASLAYKVTRTKTAIDAAGKKLNEDARAQINKVDEQRRKIRTDLDGLAEQARKPLTEWEQAEEDRLTTVGKFFDAVRALRAVLHASPSHMIEADLGDLNGMSVDPSVFLERAQEAEDALTEARQHLADALAAARKTEENERELERLRAEQDARAKADHEIAENAERERLAKQAAERAEAEAKRREAEAVERARNEERRRAEEAIAKSEREKQALIDAQERATNERLANERREAEEQARREADKKHRAAVKKEVAGAIELSGCGRTAAEKIVSAIIAGEIPHVTLRF